MAVTDISSSACSTLTDQPVLVTLQIKKEELQGDSQGQQMQKVWV